MPRIKKILNISNNTHFRKKFFLNYHIIDCRYSFQHRITQQIHTGSDLLLRDTSNDLIRIFFGYLYKFHIIAKRHVHS